MLLTASFPEWQKGISDEKAERTFEAYLQMLTNLPGEALKSAALLHVAESKFFPTIAELRQRTFDLTLPKVPTALEAWEDATTGKGSALARKILGMLGFDAFALHTADWQTLSVARSHFIREYDQQIAREESQRRRLPQIISSVELASITETPKQIAEDPSVSSSPVSREEAKGSLAALRERLQCEHDEKIRREEEAKREHRDMRLKELKEQAAFLLEKEAEEKKATVH